MTGQFAARAEEFIARVRAAPLDAATEFVLVYHCVDAAGQPLPPVRVHLEPTTKVEWQGDSAFARRFAAMLHRETIVRNIDSLVRDLPEGPIVLRGSASDREADIEATVGDVSLEILQPDGEPV